MLRGECFDHHDSIDIDMTLELSLFIERSVNVEEMCTRVGQLEGEQPSKGKIPSSDFKNLVRGLERFLHRRKILIHDAVFNIKYVEPTTKSWYKGVQHMVIRHQTYDYSVKTCQFVSETWRWLSKTSTYDKKIMVHRGKDIDIL